MVDQHLRCVNADSHLIADHALVFVAGKRKRGDGEAAGLAPRDAVPAQEAADPEALDVERQAACAGQLHRADHRAGAEEQDAGYASDQRFRIAFDKDDQENAADHESERAGKG